MQDNDIEQMRIEQMMIAYLQDYYIKFHMEKYPSIAFFDLKGNWLFTKTYDGCIFFSRPLCDSSAHDYNKRYRQCCRAINKIFHNKSTIMY